MRFWLWLTTGMVTKEWVAIHRKHHSSTDKDGDPHSPHVFGIWRLIFGGALLYADASKNKKMIDNFGVGTPDDWVERNIYSKYSNIGVILLLVVLTLLFHGWGIVIWLVQVIWIPFWAAGVVNGLGHWWGYRNTNTKDKSTNISPIGFIIGGEELHNNHHHKPASAKLSEKWFEIDIGWFWIKVFSYLKLIKIKDSNDK
jgi:stearoyl-CoA desaturase (delta-9 desaturase)